MQSAAFASFRASHSAGAQLQEANAQLRESNAQLQEANDQLTALNAELALLKEELHGVRRSDEEREQRRLVEREVDLLAREFEHQGRSPIEAARRSQLIHSQLALAHHCHVTASIVGSMIRKTLEVTGAPGAYGRYLANARAGVPSRQGASIETGNIVMSEHVWQATVLMSRTHPEICDLWDLRFRVRSAVPNAPKQTKKELEAACGAATGALRVALETFLAASTEAANRALESGDSAQFEQWSTWTANLLAHLHVIEPQAARKHLTVQLVRILRMLDLKKLPRVQSAEIVDELLRSAAVALSAEPGNALLSRPPATKTGERARFEVFIDIDDEIQPVAIEIFLRLARLRGAETTSTEEGNGLVLAPKDGIGAWLDSEAMLNEIADEARIAVRAQHGSDAMRYEFFDWKDLDATPASIPTQEELAGATFDDLVPLAHEAYDLSVNTVMCRSVNDLTCRSVFGES